MLHVRLLTYHFSDNFGALMQAYALRKWFLRRGVEAEFINYHPRYVEEGGDFDQPLNPRKWRKNLIIFYMKLTHLHRRLFGNRAQIRAFDLFRREVLGVSGPQLESIKDLAYLDDCDMLVCGSDQIWNPSAQRGLDPAYFLSFGRASRARRISYAASFGTSTLDPVFRREVRDMLSSLDGISVREMSGVGIVREVTGREVVCVPDPTILLGDFAELLQDASSVPTGHVFCYALRTGQVIGEVARYVGEELQTSILSPYNSHRRWAEIGETIYPSPVEWVQYLSNATFVVSNSFHGVALSVILQKPFVAVALSGRKKGLNDRIWNLLDQLGLRNRLLETADKKSVKQLMEQDIDWVKIKKRLGSMRAVGSDYLEKELAKMDANTNNDN